MDKLRVLVVDDTLVYRKVLAAAVDATGLATTVQVSSNGAIALEYLKKRSYDVVLLDIVMDEVDGLEALDIIRREYPHIFVIMITSESARSTDHTLQALKMGALDFIIKPHDNDSEKNFYFLQNSLQILFLEIKAKQVNACSCSVLPPKIVGVHSKRIRPMPAVKPVIAACKIDMILIAASTGGPVALECVLSKLPADFKQPILVVQHIPKSFTEALVSSLEKKCSLPVVMATEGALIEPGQVVVATGGKHMVVEGGVGQKRIKLEKTPPINNVRPAADVLFQSVSRNYPGANIVVVVLTGMGCDGQQGIKALKQECNAYCITQSAATCTVYGMPRCVDEAGLADESVDLDMIAARILGIVTGRG